MGDTISKSDLQYAVDSALHTVRNDISRISHVIDGLNRTAQEIHDVTRRLQALEQSIGQIQNTVAHTLGRPTTQRYPDPYVVAMMNDVNDLKVRFTAVEKFMAQMGEYISQRNARDDEDRQYRSA